MIKKLALVAVALAIAVPAFAHGHRDSKGLDIKNRGDQFTLSVNVANTGFNSVGGAQGVEDSHHRHHEDQKGGSLTTGDALIFSDTQASMNSTSVGGCGCFKSVKVDNNGDQDTLSFNFANTGFNSVSGNGSLGTGDAGVDSIVYASLNTTVVGN